ncbi:MAG: sugar transferase [Acidimicrobiales bacterium]
MRWHDDHAETPPKSSKRARAAVRAFDVAVATVAIIVLTPLMLAVAIAVKLDSPGPLIYGSPRLGPGGRVFKAWKFRSMYTDAEARLADILRSDQRLREEYHHFHKLRHDPRLTPLGFIIRRTSLDELPQLFNILCGEMSVVGPRPNLLSERAVFGPMLDTVLLVKPGLTGLWQISGRNRLPISERVVLDLEYVRTRTLAGDVRICLKTFVQLWRPAKHGAY